MNDQPKTPSEEITARYAQMERETDAFGRTIGVKKLRPSEQLRIAEMIGTADDASMATFRVAASVRDINGRAIVFPKNRGELDFVIDTLDSEGVQAAVIALGRLFEIEDAPKTMEESIEAAKK